MFKKLLLFCLWTLCISNCAPSVGSRSSEKDQPKSSAVDGGGISSGGGPEIFKDPFLSNNFNIESVQESEGLCKIYSEVAVQGLLYVKYFSAHVFEKIHASFEEASAFHKQVSGAKENAQLLCRQMSKLGNTPHFLQTNFLHDPHSISTFTQKGLSWRILFNTSKFKHLLSETSLENCAYWNLKISGSISAADVRSLSRICLKVRLLYDFSSELLLTKLKSNEFNRELIRKEFRSILGNFVSLKDYDGDASLRLLESRVFRLEEGHVNKKRLFLRLPAVDQKTFKEKVQYANVVAKETLLRLAYVNSLYQWLSVGAEELDLFQDYLNLYKDFEKDYLNFKERYLQEDDIEDFA